MALALVWTKRAIQGYDKIVRYLEQHWTDKEVRNFIHESDEFFTLLSQYPELLQKTSRHKNVYRGPMNKLTGNNLSGETKKTANRINQHPRGQTEDFEVSL